MRFDPVKFLAPEEFAEESLGIAKVEFYDSYFGRVFLFSGIVGGDSILFSHWIPGVRLIYRP